MEENVTRFIEYFSSKIINRKASFFIGSGISRSAGYVGWAEMLDDKAKEIGLDVKRETDLITLAQYYVNKNKRIKINESIKTFFDEKKGYLTETHSLICNMSVTSIWTTNYDSLLERQLEESNIEYGILTNDESYRDVNNNASIIVHKVHGTYSKPNECVITRDDYEKYYSKHDIVLSQLKAEMCSKSFLFLGYGFRDTDISHIFAKIRQIYNSDNPHQHYCIMKKVSKKENGTEKDDEEYMYDLQKEQHFILDMKNYGIETILVEDYNQIDLILREIRRKVYSKNILISGSCESENEYSAYLTALLTEHLVKKGYKILTGYGKNIGNMIVEGYFSGCYSRVTSPVTQFADAIKIIPFPFKNKSTKSKDIYYNLRKNMAELTTIQIVLGGKGNKEDGTYEEYKFCSKKKNLIIPVAITGGTAKIIWDEIISNEKNSLSEEFLKLDDNLDLNMMVENILKLIEREEL